MKPAGMKNNINSMRSIEGNQGATTFSELKCGRGRRFKLLLFVQESKKDTPKV